MKRIPNLDRRRFIRDVAAGTGASALGLFGRALAGQGASDDQVGGWDSGSLAHILPAASHDQFLLKCSFLESQQIAPQLQVGDDTVHGRNTDSDGRYWQFHATRLKPDTVYTLRLLSENGGALCSPWPLRTMPGPAANPARVRLLAFTCAGGSPTGGRYLPLEIRQRLFARGMSFAPDAVIANGDHIYWDLKPPLGRGKGKNGDPLGTFNPDEPVIGFENEQILKRVAEPQIAQLYGTRFRSTPMFFISDDHDYFENDDAIEGGWITFPPEALELRLQRATQNMFYPEFLRDVHRPLGLSGSAAADRSAGLSECFGTLRYGKLLEVLMYDCGRYLSLKEKFAGLIPPDAERWLIARTQAEDTQHLIHVPSTPFGWSAGKWREWYPDLLEQPSTDSPEGSNAALSTKNPKYMWQEGWFLQHQRLLAAMSSQERPAVAMSGDLHACGWDTVLQSGNLDMRSNPLRMILHGPIGTGVAWPSRVRGVGATAATGVVLERNVNPIEKNGFSVIDITPEKMTAHLFSWREPDPVESIDSLEPFDVVEIPRNA
jgi:hypothetical protein